ncbi:MAG: anti-sigma factor [Gammaproteobacteria bacterium]|nr:anti-sigma factor [Gammaproteobacteria bacterium]
MSMQHEQITQEDIHAYVDGHLNDPKKQLIDQQMQVDAQLRETIEQYQQQNALLHQLYDPVLDEAVPEHLTSLPLARKQRPVWLNMAASISLMVFGALIGWYAKDTQVIHNDIVVSLAKPAAVAHAVYTPEVRHPVEVNADEEQHLVKWLSKRLGSDIKAPELNSSGFHLVGGRLLPGEKGPAAQFMYEDSVGGRLTLYVRSKKVSEENTAFRFYQEGGSNSFYWIDGDLGYVLSGSVSRPQLLQVAQIVYQQLAF